MRSFFRQSYILNKTLPLSSIFSLSILLTACFLPANAEDLYYTDYPPDPPILHYYQKHPLEQVRVPIVLYHHIRPLSAVPDQLGKDLSVTPRHFEEQLRALQNAGYETITLDELSDALDGYGHLPRKPIVLTFDDGYDDNYSHAYPLLKRYGMHGTIFVITNLIEKKGYLTWENLRAMQSSGVIAIQSHTQMHPNLTTLSPSRAWTEMKKSKDALEEHLKTPITFFCYPYGAYTTEHVDLARRAGYAGSLTTRFGIVHSKNNLYETTRVRLTDSDTGERLIKKMALFEKLQK